MRWGLIGQVEAVSSRFRPLATDIAKYLTDFLHMASGREDKI